MNQAPGHVYGDQLRCGLCDYVLVVKHIGPDVRQSFEMRTCPNCKNHGVRSFLERSLK